MNPLGMLEPVNIRDVWQGEASHFTPWLAEPDHLGPVFLLRGRNRTLAHRQFTTSAQVQHRRQAQRLETLRSYEEELRAATGEEVFFESNADSANRSKLYVRREGDWANPENQQEIYQWLDTKHRALLKVLQPRLQNI